ncbi:MAG: hypothetical protein EPN93_15060 [Spirochaetes bacterium]|nr:MAG: hypothetical protein EPN93_15060 [Spirochaetota bacterium]
MIRFALRAFGGIAGAVRVIAPAAGRCVLCILFLGAPAAADHIPVPSENDLDYEGNLRVFLNGDGWSFFTEARGRYEGERSDFGYRALTAGPYYRVFRNLQAGAFYRLQQGARHDDDWVATHPGWEWRDTTSRNEHLLILDATPRVQLAFLPGENWVAEIKARYLCNSYFGQQTITVRPGIMYVVMRRQQPILNVYAQYELYYPLNYGVSAIYEKWMYLGIMYHASEIIKIGVYGARREVVWGTSDDARREVPGTKYRVTYRASVIGFIVTSMIEL